MKSREQVFAKLKELVNEYERNPDSLIRAKIEVLQWILGIPVCCLEVV